MIYKSSVCLLWSVVKYQINFVSILHHELSDENIIILTNSFNFVNPIPNHINVDIIDI